MKTALITNWDAIQQAIRIFLYSVLPIFGVQQAAAENYVTTGIAILGFLLNLVWSIRWNKNEVATVAGMEAKGMSSAAVAVEVAKKQV